MAVLIEAPNVSQGWADAMTYLLRHAGKASNLIISINSEGVGQEINDARQIFDTFLKAYESKRVRSIRKVADTIFPQDFYINGPGPEARKHLYRMQEMASRIERRYIRCGTYFDRLIGWPKHANEVNGDGENQLERIIGVLVRDRTNGKRNGSKYELAVAFPGSASVTGIDCSICGDLRVQDPLRDHNIMGFPCLSHISLTLCGGRLDMTALYRNQHFVTKAYGNLVGLSDLLQFIAMETHYETGELICVATHADAELGMNKIEKEEIEKLLAAYRAKLA